MKYRLSFLLPFLIITMPLSAASFHEDAQRERLSIFSSLEATSKKEIKAKLLNFVREEEAFSKETVYWLFNAARFHDLDEDPSYSVYFSSIAKRVKQLGYQIKKARSPLIDIPVDTEGLYALTAQNYESLKSNIADTYSLIKYGDGDALNYFATKLAHRIRHKFGEALYDGSWAIANTSFYRVTNTAATLTSKVKEILKLPTPLIDMRIRPKKAHLGEYGTINSFDRRYEIMKNAFECINRHDIKGKHIIYIDDLFASGMHVMEHMNIFRRHGAKSLHAIAVIDILDPILKLEGLINFTTVKVKEPEVSSRVLAEIYNKKHSVVVTRSLKLLFQLPRDTLLRCLRAIPLERAHEIVEAGDREEYRGSKLFGNGLEVARQFVLSDPR